MGVAGVRLPDRRIVLVSTPVAPERTGRRDGETVSWCADSVGNFSRRLPCAAHVHNISMPLRWGRWGDCGAGRGVNQGRGRGIPHVPGGTARHAGCCRSICLGAAPGRPGISIPVQVHLHPCGVLTVTRTARAVFTYNSSAGMLVYSLQRTSTTGCASGHWLPSMALIGRIPTAALVANTASTLVNWLRVTGMVVTCSFRA